MKRFYPVFADIAGRKILVLGAGKVATRKIRRLLSYGASVSVVSPEMREGLRRLVRRGRIRWIRSRFRKLHLRGQDAVFAATDDAEVNRAAALLARKNRIWANVATSCEESDFILPALYSEAGLTLAVSSSGVNPGRAARFAKDVRRFAGKGRTGVKKGHVYIVGAGPGDPGLLTLRALQIIKSADIIFFDRLVGKGILAEAAQKCLLVPVGKKDSFHPVPQGVIEREMWKSARMKKSVVRLKGGDPFIFGKGAEEAIYLKKRGIPVEIVPGISSVNGASLAAGIPMTHKTLSSSFSVLNGHLPKDIPVPVPETDTLVYVMCVSKLGRIVEAVARKKGRDTACALVERGTTGEQKIVTGALKNIVRRARRRNIRPPAIFIVGAVTALRRRVG